jgi:hypothetical protein
MRTDTTSSIPHRQPFPLFYSVDFGEPCYPLDAVSKLVLIDVLCEHRLPLGMGMKGLANRSTREC